MSLCRLLAIAYGFAYKMLCEIDWMSLNVPLAQLLCVSRQQFNQMESAVFAAFDYDIGLQEATFKTRFSTVENFCVELHRRDQSDQE